jgi:hypothetical protein
MLGATWVAAFATPASRAQAPVAAWPQKEFCGRAQAFVTGSTPRVTNTVHDGPESFRRTPPAAQPLTTQQYDWPDDQGPPNAARMISCKLVSADRVKAVHGPQSARSETRCEQVNRYTLGAVLAGLSPAERERARFGQGKKVRFDRDRPQPSVDAWDAPYEMASVDARRRRCRRRPVACTSVTSSRPTTCTGCCSTRRSCCRVPRSSRSVRCRGVRPIPTKYPNLSLRRARP